MEEVEDVGSMTLVLLVELFDAFLRQPHQFRVLRHDLLRRILPRSVNRAKCEMIVAVGQVADFETFQQIRNGLGIAKAWSAPQPSSDLPAGFHL